MITPQEARIMTTKYETKWAEKMEARYTEYLDTTITKLITDSARRGGKQISIWPPITLSREVLTAKLTEKGYNVSTNEDGQLIIAW